MPPETTDIIAASFALRKTIMILENGKGSDVYRSKPLKHFISELVVINKQFGDTIVLLRENRNNDYLVQYAAVIQPTQDFQNPLHTINNGDSSDDDGEDDDGKDCNESEGDEKEADEASHPREANFEDDEPNTTQNETESSDNSTIMDIFALRQRATQPREANFEDDESNTTQNESQSSDDSTIMDIFALRQR
uniref:Uncharacterized protein n=1 Tax=Panagrolaimus sp. ES5 TaxID=591445 RepID=A0AC34G7Z2_9BILA